MGAAEFKKYQYLLLVKLREHNGKFMVFQVEGNQTKIAS